MLVWLGAHQALSTAGSQSPMSPAERLRARYWNHLVLNDPLDTCSLGVASACSRLPALDGQALQERTDFEQAVVEQIDGLPLDDLPDQLSMDLVAIRRLAEHWTAGVSRDAQIGNLEYAEQVPTLIS